MQKFPRPACLAGRPARRGGLFCAALKIATILSSRLTAADAIQDLGDLTIEQLMNISVTSVSKKETKLNQSPAAIAVVTQDDIRRLGISSIPEALRLAPGMDVARISGNEWAVSARGFNSAFADKLLVLVDGRTIYTPASAGIFWNAQDVVFEDLDKIEVIRGPGATLWGTNASNGVINIRSKSAKETQGGLVSTAMGSRDSAPSTLVRYGGELAPNVFYRVFAKSFDRNNLVDSTGQSTSDDWDMLHGGVRVDAYLSAENTVTLQGDLYRSAAGKRITQINLSPAETHPGDVVSRNRGGNIIGRWTRTYSSDSALTLQGFFDQVKQGDGFGVEYREVADFDLQYQLVLAEGHSIVWGAGYRHTRLQNTPSFNLTWTPEFHTLQLFETFVQDEITLIRERLGFTLGSKLEHNSLTKWEVQPSVRLLWTPTERQTLWTAISRATNTPAVFERSARLNVAAFQPSGSPPILVSNFGNPAVDAEKMVAYELGYRITANPRLSFDLSTFYNSYRDVTDFVPNDPRFEAEPFPPHLLVSSTIQNSLRGNTYGAELSVQWRVSENWKWAGSYTSLRMDLQPSTRVEAESPRQQFQLRSDLELSSRLEVSAALFYVSSVEAPSADIRAAIPSYLRADLGLTWHPTSSVELSIWGQNLCDHRHAEFPSQQSRLIIESPRSVTARALWRF